MKPGFYTETGTMSRWLFCKIDALLATKQLDIKLCGVL
jgi:hypothetical protein